VDRPWAIGLNKHVRQPPRHPGALDVDGTGEDLVDVSFGPFLLPEVGVDPRSQRQHVQVVGAGSERGGEFRPGQRLLAEPGVAPPPKQMEVGWVRLCSTQHDFQCLPIAREGVRPGTVLEPAKVRRGAQVVVDLPGQRAQVRLCLIGSAKAMQRQRQEGGIRAFVRRSDQPRLRPAGIAHSGFD
jgi:hypothetical protein